MTDRCQIFLGNSAVGFTRRTFSDEPLDKQTKAVTHSIQGIVEILYSLDSSQQSIDQMDNRIGSWSNVETGEVA